MGKTHAHTKIISGFLIQSFFFRIGYSELWGVFLFGHNGGCFATLTGTALHQQGATSFFQPAAHNAPTTSLATTTEKALRLAQQMEARTLQTESKTKAASLRTLHADCLSASCTGAAEVLGERRGLKNNPYCKWEKVQLPCPAVVAVCSSDTDALTLEKRPTSSLAEMWEKRHHGVEEEEKLRKVHTARRCFEQGRCTCRPDRRWEAKFLAPVLCTIEGAPPC